MSNKRISDIKCEAIKQIEDQICNDLIVDYIIDHLIETNVFTQEDYKEIIRSGEEIGSAEDLAVRDRVLYKQNKRFVELLQQKFKTDDYAYYHFIFIVNKDGYYPWIGHKLMSVIVDLKIKSEQKYYKTVLKKMWAEISEDLIVDYLIQYLIDVKVFTQKDYKKIVKSGHKVGNASQLSDRNKVLTKQSNTFIHLLLEKIKTNELAFNYFLLALFKDDSYPWIGHKLKKLINQFKESEETQQTFNTLK